MSEIFSVLGHLSIDTIIDGIPFPLNYEDSRHTKGIYLRVGGGARNISSALSRLGGRVTLLSFFSLQDPLSGWVIDELTKSGLSHESVIDLPGSISRTAILLSEDGQRMIFGDSQYSRLTTQQQESILDVSIENWRQVIINSTVFVSKSFSFCLPWIQWASEQGKRVVCDFSTASPLDSAVENTLQFCDIVVLSKGDMSVLAAEKELFLRSGVSLVIATRGSAGVSLFRRQDDSFIESHYPSLAISPDQVVDTTGAGDNFLAGFLNSYCSDKNLDRAVSEGQKMAREIISMFGG